MHVHDGTLCNVTFFRDSHGLEVDAVVQDGQRAILIEAKSGEIVSSDALDTLERVKALMGTGGEHGKASKMVIHGGRDRWTQRDATALPWSGIDRHECRPR
jgi:predicted AAA+ superfamily ATPase